MSQPAIEQDDIDLNYVRQKRIGLVDMITKEGIPDDSEKQQIMLKALSDMSKDAIAKKRIKSEEKIANGNSANTAMVAAFLARYNPNASRTTEVVGVIPNVELPKPDLVEGETDIKGTGESFVSFTTRMNMA